jgi:hypothetical protein
MFVCIYIYVYTYELLGIEIKIPIIMISQRDSVLLERLLNKNNSPKKGATEYNSNSTSIEKNSSFESLQCKLVCGRFEEECSICQEIMMEGNVVLKLSCRHAYHTECVQTWLERHNTCPLCRNEMPVRTGSY